MPIYQDDLQILRDTIAILGDEIAVRESKIADLTQRNDKLERMLIGILDSSPSYPMSPLGAALGRANCSKLVKQIRKGR